MEAIDQQPVGCRRPGCGDPYSAHDAGGGACQAGAEERECWCRGFLWVDPGGPAVGSYTDPPAV